MKIDEFKASAVADDWLTKNPLFLDTETTGLGDKAQVIELAVTDSDKNVLLNVRIKPSVDIEPAAERVHGLSAAVLKNEPSWPDIAPKVQQLLAGRHVVIFNAPFDTRLLRQTADAYGLSVSTGSVWLCAMSLAAKAYGSTNRYGSISLATATAKAGVIWHGDAHTALADTLATVDLVRKIAGCMFRVRVHEKCHAARLDQ